MKFVSDIWSVRVITTIKTSNCDVVNEKNILNFKKFRHNHISYGDVKISRRVHRVNENSILYSLPT